LGDHERLVIVFGEASDPSRASFFDFKQESPQKQRIKDNFIFIYPEAGGRSGFIMSHRPTVFSPEGTPAADRTVGELVAERQNRSKIFQGLKIDFCCQGGKTLREACAAKGIAVEAVLDQLNAEQRVQPEDNFDPAALAPTELIGHIVATHHDYLRGELPRLHAMAQRVAQVHGGQTPSLVEVFEVFTGLFQEMDSHMRKEEEILFPMIAALEKGEQAPIPLDAPIGRMIEEHEDAGDALARLRVLTGDYQPPTDACNTYRALFAGLEGLEEDMHRHVHLENHILFPKAAALEAAHA
jgi:regulator of cell morphogenesis and NO signaling